MNVIDVSKESPLFGYIRKGYRLLKVNGQEVRDNLDCLYKLADESLELEFTNGSGRTMMCEVRNDDYGDLGLRFEKDKTKICKNNCLFCFVHQQPRGLRHSLYVRDDDYRLSFTHGNFISLSNLTGSDIERIIEQRLTPLYVSVHTTDDTLRRRMFGNRRLPPVMPQLKKLIEGGIQFHTQIVVCPGLNDGAALADTVDNLAALYPGVSSIGVVPVGLTRYRDGLPEIKPIDKAGMTGIIDFVHNRQRALLAKHGSRIVFAADELYISAGRKLPVVSAYEDMPQFENGIGMMRLLLTDYNRRKRHLNVPPGGVNAAVITGELACPFIRKNIINDLRRDRDYKIEVVPVANKFWGESVTVSGLLTGQDILEKILELGEEYDTVILPPNCLNDDDLFLDDMSLDELTRKTGLKIMRGSYSMIDTIRRVRH